jgi:hypothetical protein
MLTGQSGRAPPLKTARLVPDYVAPLTGPSSIRRDDRPLTDLGAGAGRELAA